MNIACGVEYRGSNYCGWQRQLHSPSVQAALESALSTVANQPVEVACAGRTDTGVHGVGQVVSFSTEAVRPLKAWTMGGNAHLPDDISIQWAQQVPDDFHARFSAVSREYRYVISNSKRRPGVLNGLATWVHAPLDHQAMHEAIQACLGECNFRSFQAANCQSPTPNRHVFAASVERHREQVYFNITANAFLYHMVRNLAGSLIEIGLGKKPISWIADLLALQDRTKAAATASADGLFFMRVNYPTQFAIPEPTTSLWMHD